MIESIVVLWIVVILLMSLMFGIPTYSILLNKGHKNYLWVGYVFGPVGLLWAIGLPDLIARETIKKIKNKLYDEE